MNQQEYDIEYELHRLKHVALMCYGQDISYKEAVLLRMLYYVPSTIYFLPGTFRSILQLKTLINDDTWRLISD